MARKKGIRIRPTTFTSTKRKKFFLFSFVLPPRQASHHTKSLFLGVKCLHHNISWSSATMAVATTITSIIIHHHSTIAHTMTSNKSNVTCQDSSGGDGCGISSGWWCYIFTALVDVSPLEIRCPHVLLLFPKPPPRPVVVRVCAWFELFQATFTATGQPTAVYLQRVSWTDQVSSPCKLVPQIKPSSGCYIV